MAPSSSHVRVCPRQFIRGASPRLSRTGPGLGPTALDPGGVGLGSGVGVGGARVCQDCEKRLFPYEFGEDSEKTYLDARCFSRFRRRCVTLKTNDFNKKITKNNTKRVRIAEKCDISSVAKVSRRT